MDHENRIDVLERRIPVDYPFLDSHLLGFLSGITGPDDFNFGWTFPDDCSDPTGLECEDIFVTSGDYLFLPSGFNGPFEVTMQCAAAGGSFNNYLTPVTPGDPTPTDDILPFFVAYVAEDNVVDLSTVFLGGFYQYWLQEPPMRPHGGTYDRVWTHVRGVPANAFVNENRRWALLPHLIYNGSGTISIAGLTFATKLYPPTSYWGQASWSG